MTEMVSELDVLRRIKASADAASNDTAAVETIQPPLNQAAGVVPTGVKLSYAGAFDNIPSGYLLCDGSGKSTTKYAGLFAVIGYTYGGAGDTFNLPDGAQWDVGYKSGTAYNTVADTVGFTWHGATENNHPFHALLHTHTVDPPIVHAAFSCDPPLNIHAWSDGTPTNLTTTPLAWDGTTALPTREKPDGSHDADHKGPENSNQDTDNRPPSQVYVWIIKT